jgi:DNA-binding PadR family transcriptional regulator
MDASNAERAEQQAARVAALLPLTPAMFHILLALAGGERHGYGIMLEVEELTEGQVKLGPGTLYRTLQRMQVEGLIEESAERGAPEEDDERRRYYRATVLGLRVAEREAARLAMLVKAARARKLLAGPAGRARRSR